MRAVAALRFAVELGAVAMAAAAGAEWGWALAVAAPVALLLAWERFVAPRSPRRLADPGRLVVEVALFTGVGALVTASGRPLVGVAFVVISVATAVAVRQGGPMAPDGSADRR